MTTILLFLALTSAASSAPLDSLHPFEVVRKAESLGRNQILSLDADSSHSYDMLSLSLDYRVEAEAGSSIFGLATLTLRALEHITQIKLNAEGMTVFSVSESVNTLQYVHLNDTLYVQRELFPGDIVILTIQLSAPPAEFFVETGYHVEWQAVFTFSEPFGARKWIPCFDQPFDKFNEITIAVNMPEAWSLAANGTLISTTYPEAGRKREVYHHNHPICTYLVSIVAGYHSKWFETVDGIDYRYFAFPQDSMAAAYDWERTPQMMALFESKFGNYPFQEYGMAEASVLNGWGAMEHQTITTYGWRLIDSTRTYEGVVAHELGHMWFGDHLSPVDFRDIWLNEGFATYASVLWNEHLNGDSALRVDFINLCNAYFAEDEEIRYALYDPPPEKLFGAAIYAKGAAVLHMLRVQLMGDNLFFQGLQHYVSEFAGGNVTSTDFRDAMSEAYGQNLNWFFDQWVFQAGHPELEITVIPHSPTPNQFQVRVKQEQINAPIFRFPLLIDVVTDSATFTIQSWVESQSQTNIISYSGLQSAQLAEFQPLIYETAGVPETPIPSSFKLGAAYPNPFNATTTIPIDLSSRQRIQADLYDLTGRFIRTVAYDVFEAGKHEIRISADPRLGSGIYFVRVEAGHNIQNSKIVLLK